MRLAHIYIDHLKRLKSKDLVSGLPKIKFENNRICDACQKGKQTRSSFKLKDVIYSIKPLDIYWDHLELLVWVETIMPWLL